MVKSLVCSICIISIGMSCNNQETALSAISISDPNLVMELVATSPDIQTPIGMAIDQEDNLYVVESHTHTPAPDYTGPQYDRIKKGIDDNGDGIPENWIIYADSLEDAMNLAFGPEMELFVTTKDAVWVFEDQNRDGISDQRRLLLDMISPDSPYDHAAILGVAVSPDHQWLFVSRGNTGSAYWEIVGTDGSSIGGYGDGGNVMRCRLDGSALEEVATGFWNPFDIKFTTDGRLMLTDNDPDSRGPNRLIEIVPGGDYGYKSLYGGSGLHPFVAWNAELVGTLPYAAPLGEAPCALLDAGFTGFGQDYQNSLLVNVWEEKNIVKIPMEAKGSSVKGVPQVLIQGDTTFHPVALVANSQGDLYLTNWVLRQYPNHGKGEIWRIRPKSRSDAISTVGTTNYRFHHTPGSMDEILDHLNSDDLFLQSMARWKLGKDADYHQLIALLDHPETAVQLQGLLVLQKHPQLVEVSRLSELLGHGDLRMRQAALFYIGTRQVEEAMPSLTAALKSGNITPELFDSFLAAVQNLQPEFVQGFQQRKESKSNRLKRVLPENFIAEIIADRQTEEAVRALALPYLDRPQDHQELLLKQLRESKNEPYQISLIDALSSIANNADIQEFNELMLNILMNKGNPVRVRSMAAAAMVQPNSDQCANMLQTLSTADVDLQYAIVKKLCTCGDEAVEEWITANASMIGAAALSSWERCNSGGVNEISYQEFKSSVNDTGSALRGELVFKSSSSLCQSCHQVQGWGGAFGPDLTKIGSSKNKQQLIDAILYPSKEMAPEWQGWYVVDQEGNRHIGRQIDVHLNNVELMNINGEFDSYHKPKSYGVAEKSVMPEGLQNTMTKIEFNDLIAYLSSLR